MTLVTCQIGVSLEPVEVVASPAVTHIRYRVGSSSSS